MTIIAGFKCHEGVVLCADTQETIGHAKKHAPKLIFRPIDLSSDENYLAAAFCGAGDGPFIDKLVDTAWKSAQPAASLDEACGNIENSIKNHYEEFGNIYQQGACPEVQLIYGVKMDGDSRLFDAFGPLVNEKESCDSGGVGAYMADFLSSRMYAPYLDIHQCVILAAYILFQTKEHVDGCGGDSHIAILRNTGSSGPVDLRRVDLISNLLKIADVHISRTLLDIANLDLTKEEFKKNMEMVADVIDTFREAKREELNQSVLRWHAFERLLGGEPVTRDSFGLPIDSDVGDGGKD